MKAIIIGATGATGSDLLELLLKDNDYEQIDVFVRREINFTHPKLKCHIVDFDTISTWKHLIKGDVLFSCLGTTLKDAGSKQAQYTVDYTYQYEFAKAAKENGVYDCVLISAAMASAKSPIFYSKIKGQLEEDIKLLKFAKFIIFKAPMLLRKETDRGSEIIAIRVFKFLKLMGIAKSQQPLPTEQLVKAMLLSVKTLKNGEYVLNRKDMLKFVQH